MELKHYLPKLRSFLLKYISVKYYVLFVAKIDKFTSYFKFLLN